VNAAPPATTAKGLRVAFAGTPAFAAAALRAVLASKHAVVQVWTQPDRPAGRGQKLQSSAVKLLAAQAGVPVLQPQGLRLDGRFARDAAQAHDALAAAAVDVMVVAAYGLILPPWVLALPRLGCLNIHASLLPRWRGAAPIQRAIEAGDGRTGVTIMQMDAGLDTGNMLLEQAFDLAPDETAASLHDRLAALGAVLIVRALDAAACGALVPRAQPGEGVTYAHKIDKHEATIDWTHEAAAIERRIRAFDPFPGASFERDGQTLKCWRARVVDGAAAPGTVLRVEAGEPVVACGHGALQLTVLHRPAGRRQPARECLQNAPLAAGDTLARPPMPSRAPTH
jgi:methionyl-tRNA formyltransferase